VLTIIYGHILHICICISIQVPEDLECLNTNIDAVEPLMQYLQGVNITYQKLSQIIANMQDLNDQEPIEEIRSFCTLWDEVK